LVWLAVTLSPSQTALYGTTLVAPVTKGSVDHRGVAAPQMEEFENQVE